MTQEDEGQVDALEQTRIHWDGPSGGFVLSAVVRGVKRELFVAIDNSMLTNLAQLPSLIGMQIQHGLLTLADPACWQEDGAFRGFKGTLPEDVPF